MKNIMALMLVGGQVKEMGVLLRHRSKAALPFGGMYRVVDFTLTNLSRSNIPSVGLLSQYRPSSLVDHVGVGRPWDYNQRSRELMFLPPNQGRTTSDWYKGTADAIFQNLAALDQVSPQHVLVLSGDHVYNMDYRPLIEYHISRHADLTMVFKPMDVGRPSRFGIGRLSADNRVTDYWEKPADPQSNLASLTIYVFRYNTLVRRILENARLGRTFQLYDEVIPRMIKQGDKVFGYIFDGAWKYLRTLQEYHSEHILLAQGRSCLAINEAGVITNLDVQGVGDAAPAYVLKDCTQTLLSPGVMCMGRVYSSVLSPWVVVREGAKVENSVLMAGTIVEKGAIVRNAVLDKDVKIGQNAVVDGGTGLAVLGRQCVVLDGHKLGPGQVEPGVVI